MSFVPTRDFIFVKITEKDLVTKILNPREWDTVTGEIVKVPEMDAGYIDQNEDDQYSVGETVLFPVRIIKCQITNSSGSNNVYAIEKFHIVGKLVVDEDENDS